MASHLASLYWEALYNLCFSFLLGITVVPRDRREIEDIPYAKFWRPNKVYYGDVQMANGFLHAEEAKSNHG